MAVGTASLMAVSRCDGGERAWRQVVVGADGTFITYETVPAAVLVRLHPNWP